MAESLSGGCLCGAVRYDCKGAPMVVGHCHCEACRKSSGTGHCTHMGIAEDSFTISGEVRFYDRAADSGNIISRGFCPNCGSPVYSKNAGVPGMVFPRVSSLDDPETVKPEIVVYASRAPSWDLVDPALQAFPEMPEKLT